MPKLAANLSWIYQEVPFLQRFGAAAQARFGITARERSATLVEPVIGHLR